MESSKKKEKIFEDVKISVKIKLAALWVAVMFIYVYADIKTFFVELYCSVKCTFGYTKFFRKIIKRKCKNY